MTSTINRCPWCGNDPLYVAYHDQEWGKQVKDDKTLFEFLVLESAQAGLSWFTILKRREGYRKLFANFDVKKVAAFTEEDIERIVLDPAIIRHRGKISATVRNAQIFIEIQKEFGSFYNYLYNFLPNQQRKENSVQSMKNVTAETEESKAIAKDLKKRGMKFFGSTICYAYMQAVGMVNDHLLSCDFRN
ncbi:DNA-3-methyladenine glycosylase I [Sphingobacterium bovistauri]|uniref:DNA-3-methyladenine glycosylase I n=1 Tax=Sphingobacterium bovistauri TaxID=2781959 RepID=A0ABS7Z2K1_9SPHI|nr:DNA-3-methyladenine glycosylase I [Sphingobacterium bovistauri]MCA5004355.1 DNA-3-methyladenine glycosylase I [Sphingobacterium bovistauri]